jgi:hypothetical protein
VFKDVMLEIAMVDVAIEVANVEAVAHEVGGCRRGMVMTEMHHGR